MGHFLADKNTIGLRKPNKKIIPTGKDSKSIGCVHTAYTFIGKMLRVIHGRNPRQTPWISVTYFTSDVAAVLDAD